MCDNFPKYNFYFSNLSPIYFKDWKWNHARKINILVVKMDEQLNMERLDNMKPLLPSLSHFYILIDESQAFTLSNSL